MLKFFAQKIIFITLSLPKFASGVLMREQKNINTKKWCSDDFHWQFQKISYISKISVARKKYINFAFTYVLESLVLFYRDFGINSYGVDSNTAIKRGDESLYASSLQFFRSVKCLIALSLRLFI
jgi:hypothetical protein